MPFLDALRIHQTLDQNEKKIMRFVMNACKFIAETTSMNRDGLDGYDARIEAAAHDVLLFLGEQRKEPT